MALEHAAELAAVRLAEFVEPTRIVVAEQALRIAEEYHIVLLVHDEIVLCVKNQFAKKALCDLTEAMEKPLPWCEDLPVSAEGQNKCTNFWEDASLLWNLNIAQL